MSEENDFIIWQGGPCPVDLETIVEVMLSNGSVVVNRRAGGFDWQRGNYGGDIVAYRVIEAQKPQVQIPEGFTSWLGGACPVAASTRVDVVLRNGSQGSGLAGCYRWAHGQNLGDIIAYRVRVIEPAKPQVKIPEGFTPWLGGERPFYPWEHIEVVFDDDTGGSWRAGELRWTYDKDLARNIVAYRREEVSIPEGFTRWAGGECPVAADTQVEVVFADGKNAFVAAKHLQWSNHPDFSIIAYRVRVIEDEKPKVQTARDTQVGGDHYKTAGVQPWDVVDTWPIEQQIGFHRGNALKYVMRMGTKDENLREIRKAAHYLQKLVEVLEQKGGV